MISDTHDRNNELKKQWVNKPKTKQDALIIITELSYLDELLDSTSKEIQILKDKFDILDYDVIQFNDEREKRMKELLNANINGD